MTEFNVDSRFDQFNARTNEYSRSPSKRGQGFGQEEFVSEEIVYDTARSGNFLDGGYNNNVRTQSNTFNVEPTRKSYNLAPSSNYVVEEPRAFGKSVGGGAYKGYQEYKSMRNTGTTTAIERERVIEPTKTAYIQQEVEIIRDREPIYNNREASGYRDNREVSVYNEQPSFYDRPQTNFVEVDVVRDDPVISRQVDSYIRQPVQVVRSTYNDGEFVDLNDDALLELIRNEVQEVGDKRQNFNSEIQLPSYTETYKGKNEFSKYEDQEAAPGWFCGMCVAPRKKKEKKSEAVYAPAPMKYERTIVEEPTVITGEPARVLGYREQGKQEIFPDPITSYAVNERRGEESVQYSQGGRRGGYPSNQQQVFSEVIEEVVLDRSGTSGRRYNWEPYAVLK